MNQHLIQLDTASTRLWPDEPMGVVTEERGGAQRVLRAHTWVFMLIRQRTVAAAFSATEFVSLTTGSILKINVRIKRQRRGSNRLCGDSLENGRNFFFFFFCQLSVLQEINIQNI